MLKTAGHGSLILYFAHSETHALVFLQRRPSADVAFETDLEMRVARSRQTMDFAARQRIRFGTLSRAQLTIMDALALMDTLPRYYACSCRALSSSLAEGDCEEFI